MFPRRMYLIFCFLCVFAVSIFFQLIYKKIVTNATKLNSNVKLFCSHYAIGDVLRELIVKPEDVEYQILKYSDKDTRLQPDLNGEYDKEKIGSGDLRALSLKFSLPSGCYATVALRQLTR
ncbi:hypothetical protein Tcan_02062 [Toxocara canis]|uniref:TRUD domain-containing protein n=1 Tax=Toxocara canis TaxID=6265 RepID=A0A0B2UL92_TOXCA|nr:hypothetical protein Tcan_02062 [Toxocara canis]